VLVFLNPLQLAKRLLRQRRRRISNIRRPVKKLVLDSKLLQQIPLGFSHLLRIYIYVVLQLPMLLLLTDPTRMLFLSVLDVLVLLYRRGWPTS
jgi:hypothetical protein